MSSLCELKKKKCVVHEISQREEGPSGLSLQVTTHVGLLIFKCKSNMAARPRRMNVDEALAEIFADRDSDLSDDSDQESQDVTEHSENSSESDVRKRTKV